MHFSVLQSRCLRVFTEDPKKIPSGSPTAAQVKLKSNTRTVAANSSGTAITTTTSVGVSTTTGSRTYAASLQKKDSIDQTQRKLPAAEGTK